MISLGPQRNLHKNARRKNIYLILIVVIIVMLSISFRSPIGGFFRFILTPVWQVEFVFLGSIEKAVSILQSKNELVKENFVLKKQILTVEELKYTNNDLIDKNTKLETMLGREGGFKRIAAVVLKRPPFIAYDTIILDVGELDGVKSGDFVYTPSSSLVGDVIEVSNRSSVILLFSAPGRETSVLVGKNSIPTKAIGRGGGNFLAMLAVETSVEIGDQVKIPSLSASVLGVVEHIDVDSADSIQTIYFKNIFNINDLDILEINTSNKI